MTDPIYIYPLLCPNSIPSIHPLPLILFRVVGGLEPIPAVIEQEAGYNLDRLPICYKASTEGQRTTHA